MSSSSASVFFLGPTRNSASGMRRVPRTLASSSSACSTSSGGSASPAGDAVPRLPPMRPAVADLRRPDGARRLGERRQLARDRLGIASVYVRPAPSRIVPFSRDHPRSSSTSFRFRKRSGRKRSKLTATITSVPPWIGTASGWSDLRRSASSRTGSEDVHETVLPFLAHVGNPERRRRPEPALGEPVETSTSTRMVITYGRA